MKADIILASNAAASTESDEFDLDIRVSALPNAADITVGYSRSPVCQVGTTTRR